MSNNKGETASINSQMWSSLVDQLKSSISSLGKIKKFEEEPHRLKLELDNCILYFLYQKYDRYIDTVICDKTGKYGKEHMILLHPSLELFLIGDLKLYSVHFKKGPEVVQLESGEKETFGYVARLLENEKLHRFVSEKFRSVSDYNSWYIENRDAIFAKMRETASSTNS